MIMMLFVVQVVVGAVAVFFCFCAVPVDGSSGVIVTASHRHGLFIVRGHETDSQWFWRGIANYMKKILGRRSTYKHHKRESHTNVKPYKRLIPVGIIRLYECSGRLQKKKKR